MAAQPKKVGKARKNGKDADAPDGLWIAPRYRLKEPADERAWETSPGGIPNSSKFLELADVALGLKKPEHHIKRPKAIEAHDTSKIEPYSKV